MSSIQIKTVQKFAIELNGKIKEFNTESEALEFLASAQSEVDAAEYATARGYEGKVAAQRANVVQDYLNWVAAGKPVTEKPEPEVAEGSNAADPIADILG